MLESGSRFAESSVTSQAVAIIVNVATESIRAGWTETTPAINVSLAAVLNTIQTGNTGPVIAKIVFTIAVKVAGSPIGAEEAEGTAAVDVPFIAV